MTRVFRRYTVQEFTLTFDRQQELAAGRNADAVFGILYRSVRYGRSGQRDAPGIDVVRSEARIRRALDKVSEPDTTPVDVGRCGKCQEPIMLADDKSRKLRPEGGVVTLQAADFDRLKDYLEKKVTWTGDAVLEVSDASDFLIAAKERAKA
jgi:hypothetical protein